MVLSSVCSLYLCLSSPQSLNRMAMSISKVFIVSILISLVLLQHVQADSTAKTNTAPKAAYTIDCGTACAARCRLSSRPNLCKRACGTCCSRCSCVPPGTSGNQQACPCYYAMTTRGGKRKCP